MIRKNEISRNSLKDIEESDKISSNKIIAELIKQISEISNDFLIVCDGPDWMRQFLHPIALRLDFIKYKTWRVLYKLENCEVELYNLL